MQRRDKEDSAKAVDLFPVATVEVKEGLVWIDETLEGMQLLEGDWEERMAEYDGLEGKCEEKADDWDFEGQPAFISSTQGRHTVLTFKSSLPASDSQQFLSYSQVART